MPRRRRNVDLARKVLDYVKGRGCALTGDVAAALGISGDRAYHILQALAARGELCIVRAGFNIWCIPGAAVDPFAAAVPCLAEVRNILRELGEAARGGVVSVVPVQVARELARRCRMPPPFSLLVMVNSYLSYLLAAVAERAKTRYIVPKGRLLDLTSKPPEVRPPCVSQRRPAASRNSYMATVTFRLPHSVLGELDRLASQLGLRRSDVIRRAIEAYIRSAAAAPPQAAQEMGLEEAEDFPVIRGRV
jgi:predicted transcriptional regulator